jgi:hypothetical protein
VKSKKPTPSLPKDSLGPVRVGITPFTRCHMSQSALVLKGSILGRLRNELMMDHNIHTPI